VAQQSVGGDDQCRTGKPLRRRVYVLLAAPDVAMAEAAIGSGLATLIFLYTMRKTDGGREP
jgi:uncharacterized MnhB-related membrane protein